MGQAISDKSENELLCEVPETIKDSSKESISDIERWIENSGYFLNLIFKEYLNKIDVIMKSNRDTKNTDLTNLINKFIAVLNDYLIQSKGTNYNTNWINLNVPNDVYQILELKDMEGTFIDSYIKSKNDYDMSINLIEKKLDYYRSSWGIWIWSPAWNRCRSCTMVEKLEALKGKLKKKNDLLYSHRFNKLEEIKNTINEIKERIDDYTSIPDTDDNIIEIHSKLRDSINHEVHSIKTTIEKWNI